MDHPCISMSYILRSSLEYSTSAQFTPMSCLVRLANSDDDADDDDADGDDADGDDADDDDDYGGE